MLAPKGGGGYGRVGIVAMLTGIVPMLFALRATSAYAGPFTTEQQASFATCEKSPPASQVKDCTSAGNSKAFEGQQLAGLYVNRANDYDASEDKVQALSDYNKAVESAPDPAAIYYNRALIYSVKGDLSGAVADAIDRNDGPYS